MRGYYSFIAAALLLMLLPMQSSDGWKTVRSRSGLCEVMMPAEPQLNKDKNGTYEYYTCEVPATSADTNYYYGMIYLAKKKGETSPGSEKWLNGFYKKMKADIVDRPGHRLIYEKDIKLDGHPGREYFMSDHNRKTLLTYRIYVYDDAVYQLFTGTPVNKYPTATMKKFFASFKVSK